MNEEERTDADLPESRGRGSTADVSRKEKSEEEKLLLPFCFLSSDRIILLDGGRVSMRARRVFYMYGRQHDLQA